MDGAVSGLPGCAAEAASDSVGAAHNIGAEMGGSAGAKLIHLADASFVDALSSTAMLGAAAAVIGAVIALAFLPSRERGERPETVGVAGGALPEAAAA
jgi:hypothetical protein